ncbi:MAG: NUDIX domain-containing protein [Chitinivibrionales bacterium]|nr:NUDIX domain-containing protein [Chitinivibrionales bacterium]
MPYASVAAVITRTEHNAPEVLLTRRNVEPFDNHWCLPGGHIEKFETRADAVIREVREETGLDVTPQELGTYDEIFPEYDFHNVVTAYYSEATGEVKIDPVEVRAADWFTIDNALSLPLAFEHEEILRAYQAQQTQ